jgi:hypothetical protein
LKSVELAISTPLSLSSSVFLGTLDAIADGCAFTAPVHTLLPTGFAVVVAIGSCDDGHVFVVFAAAIVAAVAFDVIAATVADGCAFTAPVHTLLPTGFAVVVAIGSCDDGHVFVVFAAAILAAVAFDVIAATVADGCAFTALVQPLLPTGFAVVVAIVVDCDIVFLFFIFIVRGSSTIIIFFCPPKEDENKGAAVSQPADGFDLPSLVRMAGFNQFLMLVCAALRGCPALGGSCC